MSPLVVLGVGVDCSLVAVRFVPCRCVVVRDLDIFELVVSFDLVKFSDSVFGAFVVAIISISDSKSD